MTTQEITPAGWYPDPGHRHQYRYWSGTEWTPMVSDNAVTATDPVQSSPPPLTAGQLPPVTLPSDEAKMTASPTSAGPASVPGTNLELAALRGRLRRLPAKFAMVERREKVQKATARGTGPGKQSTATGWVKWRNPWTIGGLAMVVVLALVAGVLFFMTRAPETPTGVRAAESTATSVLVEWNPSTGGRSVDKYLILRDGAQVGSVSGNSSTYLDNGLSPGSEHRYRVVASSGSRRSDPSTTLVTSTVAPSPVRLAAGSSTITALTFRWSPPPDSPTPDKYVILRDGFEIQSIAGTATSYRDSGLVPLTTFRYQVAAEWAGVQSKPTTELVMKTDTPTLASARLAGSWPVHVKVARTPGGNVKAGTTWTTTWQFSPKCKTGPCAVVVTGDALGGGYNPHSFRATLTRHGTSYKGTTKSHITHCGNGSTVVDISNTITLTIRLKGAAMDGKSWAADRWAGTMVITSPYKSAGGGYYCPAQSISTTISGSN